MTKKKIGYIRVSTKDQNLDLQRAALLKAGVEAQDIYEEQISGVAKNRPILNQVLELLELGDILVVWKSDRLGRDLLELLQIIRFLGEKGITFLSLTEEIDTTNHNGRLQFNIKGAVAEYERENSIERIRAGMATAKANGAKFGRPVKCEDPILYDQIKFMRSEGHSQNRIAKTLNISWQTVGKTELYFSKE